ncbi:MAG TPA: hypothetical protein VH397_19315 [Xanthobacteraceae bacterium]
MSSNARLVTLLNVPLAAAAGLLLWRSLNWPLVGDAAIFHFIASQMQMGAVPYRDIVDINMPLIYFIHLAVVATGGMGDVAWRAFDLAAAALMSSLILALVWPAGRAPAILAALVVLVTHLLLGPYSAGQRDYLMSIAALAATLASARAAENPERRPIDLVLAGACAVTAASIKPSGLILLALPAVAMAGLRWREAAWIMAGAAGAGLLLLGLLAASGELRAFIAMVRGLMPAYASMGSRTISDVFRDTFVWLAPTGGLALAAALNIAAPKPPRLRAMIGLTLFGLIHLLVQRKGWFYHVYPLGIGLACWGAWSLAALPMLRAALCLTITAATLAWLLPPALTRARTYPALRAAAAMQSALENRLPRGARVQVLDSDNGAFLAMARAGMRQATPHIQWFSLLLADESVRQEFLHALVADPPAAILLTNAQWPQASGFDAADRWPELAALLASGYVLDRTGSENGVAWRLYLRRAPSSRTYDALPASG